MAFNCSPRNLTQVTSAVTPVFPVYNTAEKTDNTAENMEHTVESTVENTSAMIMYIYMYNTAGNTDNTAENTSAFAENTADNTFATISDNTDLYYGVATGNRLLKMIRLFCRIKYLL